MVKYCQECGNPSYDGATICGNCGAEFPPKSDINSKPPALNVDKNKNMVKSDFNFSKSVGGLRGISKKLNESTQSSNLSKDEQEKQIQSTYTKSSVIGFKEKDKGTKDPARKFKTTQKTEKPIRTVPINENKIKVNKNKEEIENPFVVPTVNKSKINKKSIALIAIIIIILIAIVGVSIMSMTNNSSGETLYFSDDAIGFYYPDSWSMYNNTDANSAGNIAFKTPDKVLIGYTKVVNSEITLDQITAEINATAQSLGGNITEYKNITIDGVPATDITINSADHGCSRYISIIHNGIYYSFVITTGQTDNPSDASSLTGQDIQNMIQSIKFSDLTQSTNTQV